MTRFPHVLTTAVVVVMLALLTGGVMFYHAQEQQVRQQVEERLTAITRLKVDQIAAWRGERLDEGAKLIERPLLGRRIARWLTNPRISDQEALLAEFRVLLRHEGYSDVLVLDENGRVRLSLSGRTRVIETEAQALVAARRDDRPVLTDLHTEADGSRPHISVVVPVFSGDGTARRPLGAVILLTDARRFLYPLVQSWPTPSATAETLVIRRDGGDVLFLNELRHRADTALKLRIPLSQTDVPAVMAVQGKVGIVEGLDYRGTRVVSVLQAIPNSPWFMVAKVDTAEAFAGWYIRSRIILALFLGLVILTGVVGIVIWQRNEKAHYRALFQAEAARRQSEERHRITLMSVGDGVIATDAEGRVEVVNPVAETLTGWASADARGRSLDEIFRIVNEETRQPVESPVARVLREGTVVGLANHTVLLAKEGIERPIANSGAPIRDEEGSLTGEVLVFRDQTEARAAQKALVASEARYRRLFEAAKDGILILDAGSGGIVDVNPFLADLLGYSSESFKARRSGRSVCVEILRRRRRWSARCKTRAMSATKACLSRPATGGALRWSSSAMCIGSMTLKSSSATSATSPPTNRQKRPCARARHNSASCSRWPPSAWRKPTCAPGNGSASTTSCAPSPASDAVTGRRHGDSLAGSPQTNGRL